LVAQPRPVQGRQTMTGFDARDLALP
jgi:hypothetical protein